MDANTTVRKNEKVPVLVHCGDLPSSIPCFRFPGVVPVLRYVVHRVRVVAFARSVVDISVQKQTNFVRMLYKSSSAST